MKPQIKSFLFLLVLLSISEISIAQTKISVQGVIRQSDGNAIDDGLYSITFKLYDTIVAGNLLWVETQAQVKITSGIYSTILGSVTPLDLQFDEFYFLSLTVEGEELLPRAPLTSAPYANSMIGFDNKFPSTGDVGVGTLAPTHKLEVVGDTKLDGELEITGSRLHVDTSGNVGIGTLTPTHKLEVHGNAVFTGNVSVNSGELGVYNPTNGNTYLTVSNTSGSQYYVRDVGGTAILENGGGDIRFYANGGYRMRINNTGVKLGGDGQANVACDVQGSILYSGTLNGVSDRRLKENISPVTNVLGKISNLQAFTYNKIADPKKKLEYGVMAQDLQKVFPEMVSIIDPKTGYLGVSYIELIPVLIEANKELQTINTDIYQQMKSLQAENNKLSEALSSQVNQSNARFAQLEASIKVLLEAQEKSKL